MSKKTVTRCVCHKRTFVEIKQIAFKKGINSVEELMKFQISCCGCGLCKPYIAKMFLTGETAFAPEQPEFEDQ